MQRSSAIALAASVLLALPACQPQAVPSGRQTKVPGPPPLASSDTAGNTAPSEPRAALMAAYRAAHERRDVAAALALYCFDGAASDVREVSRENVEHQMRHPLKEMSIAPVPADYQQVRQEGKVRWRSSLPDVAMVTARFDTSGKAPGEWAVDEAVLPVGMKSGRCYFTVPVRED